MNKSTKYGLSIFFLITVIIFIVNLFFSLFGNNIILLILASLISATAITALVVYSGPILKDYLATYRTMMRLENLSHPLLLQLSLETPGTYQHSLMVANLAHRVAKAIGANSILTRIGGYYHDIGKIQNPPYFVENQPAGENPHAEINNPRKSAKIIIDHVINGTKMARENNLPKEIIDLIEQHHGTTMVSFFYDQAKKKNYKINKDDFSYPGPKPLSVEAVILMLSDAIEAKIRLSNKVTPLVIRETVDEIVNLRMKEKQFDLSGIDQNKIEQIRQSFIETLSTMFHQRIKYPSDEKNEKRN